MSKVSENQVVNALNTLKNYCTQCTPNDSLDDCIKNCVLYKYYACDNDGCYIRNMFCDGFGDFIEKEFTVKFIKDGFNS